MKKKHFISVILLALLLTVTACNILGGGDDVPDLETYQHPSGRFDIGVPADVQIDEIENEVVIYVSDTSAVDIYYEDLEVPATVEDLEAFIEPWLEMSLLDTGWASSFNVKSTSSKNDYVTASFTYEDDFGGGEGRLEMIQYGAEIYVLEFTSGEFDQLNDLYKAMRESFNAKPVSK
jgi:predicted small secreted protein